MGWPIINVAITSNYNCPIIITWQLIAVQFWRQIFFFLCNKSCSTYSSLSLPCVLLAERRELHIKALHQHFPTGHNMVTKILLSTVYAQEPKNCLEPVFKEHLYRTMWLYDLFDDVMGLTVILILFSENIYKEQAERVISELANTLKNVVVRGKKMSCCI